MASKLLWYGTKEDLSVRAFNCLRSFEFKDDDALLEYFERNKTFLHFRNVGKKSNEEICIYCETLLKEREETKSNSSSNGNENTAKVEIRNTNEDNSACNSIVLIYEEAKSKYFSVRVNNILKELEIEENYELDIDFKINFIIKYFYLEKDLNQIKRLGFNSINELKNFRKELIDYDLLKEINRLSNDQIYLINLIESIFSYKFLVINFDCVYSNRTFSFNRLFCILLKFSLDQKKNSSVVLKELCFKETPTNINKIADALGCSSERIRQIQNRIKNSIIPELVSKILKEIKCEFRDLPFAKNDYNYILVDKLIIFEFNKFEYTPNSFLTKIVYSSVYKEKYFDIEELIEGLESFNSNFINLFVSRSFSKVVHLPELLVWVNVQIKYFLLYSYEYRIDALVERFFEENDYLIESDLINDLVAIVKIIKKEPSEIILKDIVRIKRNEKNLNLQNEIYSFLKEKITPQPTKNIINYLFSRHNEVSLAYLLRFLNKNHNTFIRIVNGFWGLKENQVNTDSKGSLRSIVANYLRESDEPIHVSEIFNYITQYHRTNIRSLYTNLRSDANNTFIFFNCAFIGLKGKDYAKTWYTLPSFKIFHLTQCKNKFGKNKSNENIVNYLYLTYGYPKKHISFILENKASLKK